MIAKSLTLALALGTAASVSALDAAAAAPGDLEQQFAAAARQSTPGFSGFSAERGQRFFNATHGNDWSCASCHTQDPLARGKHAATGKEIAPFAPAANPRRFPATAVPTKNPRVADVPKLKGMAVFLR